MKKQKKQYQAAIVISGDSPALQQKIANCQRCANLLSKAKESESLNQYSEAANYYLRLYDIHPLTTYKDKAKAMQHKVDEIAKQKEQAAQAERNRIAHEQEKEKILILHLQSQSYEYSAYDYLCRGVYRSSIDEYNKALNILGSYAPDSLKQRYRQAQQLQELYEKAYYAKQQNKYAEALQCYSELYNMHRLYKWKIEINELNNKIQEQQKIQNVQRKKALEETQRQEAIESISAANNTISFRELIERPLGVDVTWTQLKSVQRRAIEKKFPAFKNSPNRDDYKLQAEITGVTLYAPLSFASFEYNDSNTYPVKRMVTITYKWDCSNTKFAEVLVQKLKQDLETYKRKGLFSVFRERGDYLSHYNPIIFEPSILNSGNEVIFTYIIVTNV